MSFTKVIKASKPQQSISSFVACCQQKGYQPQNSTNSIANQLNQNHFSNQKNLILKKSTLWQNDNPALFLHRYLLQNISSLNSLSNIKKHDYSQFQSDQFVHCLQLQDQEINSGIIQTETIKSQYMESVKPSYQTQSDNQSVFQFQFQNQQIIERKY